MALRHGSIGWLLALLIAAATVVAAGVLAMLWQMRGGLTRSREEIARQAAQIAQLSREAQRQAEESGRHTEEIGRQSARIGELSSDIAHYREREEKLRDECAQLRGSTQEVRDQASALEHAVRHTVTERIPNALMGMPVPDAEDAGLDKEVAALLSETVACATDAGEQQDSMRSAVVAMARRVQASAHRIQEEATLMADRHPGNADVLEVSMRVDHAAAQQARTAQSMAVLLGEWPGQQWPDPLPLVDVVRAAAGRIIAYRRVEVAGDQDIAAAAPAVEPLIHLVAELLANATQSSPPTTQVPVTVRSVQRGAVIEVHDCGVGLDDYRLAQARATATGERTVGLEGLGEFPQTGLAVVGQYVRRHGFRVDISESVYGGVRAIVGIPSELTETVQSAETMPVPAARAPHETAAAKNADTAKNAGTAINAGTAKDAGTATEESGTPTVADPPAVTSRNGLPRRTSPRHGPADAMAGLAGSASLNGSTPGSSLEQPTPEEAGAWMGAFLTSEQPGGPGLVGTQPGDPGVVGPGLGDQGSDVDNSDTLGDVTETSEDNSTGQQEQR